MSPADPAAAMNGTRTGNICSRCNKGIRSGDLVRGYVTHYPRDGWVLRRLYCDSCGDTSIEHGTEDADEAIIEAVYWNGRLAGVETRARSREESA
ncbi:hypothetical protein [Halovenus marina]|uniref:hypothetical protein n=1 Tax=Halovenus marina TaxID=3396621 RepID=UPI003F54C149